MKLITKILLFTFIGISFFLLSCIKEEHYPIEPKIDFLQFATLKGTDNLDSIGRIVIAYTDGDGDIGLSSKDTVEPYRYNYYLNIFQRINNQDVELLPADTNSNFNGRIPMLTPNGANKNIKGEIALDINLYYARIAMKSDTIRFKIYILDRALHQSNTVTTPLFKIVNRPSR